MEKWMQESLAGSGRQGRIVVWRPSSGKVVRVSPNVEERVLLTLARGIQGRSIKTYRGRGGDSLELPLRYLERIVNGITAASQPVYVRLDYDRSHYCTGSCQGATSTKQSECVCICEGRYHGVGAGREIEGDLKRIKGTGIREFTVGRWCTFDDALRHSIDRDLR